MGLSILRAGCELVMLFCRDVHRWDSSDKLGLLLGQVADLVLKYCGHLLDAGA